MSFYSLKYNIHHLQPPGAIECGIIILKSYSEWPLFTDVLKSKPMTNNTMVHSYDYYIHVLHICVSTKTSTSYFSTTCMLKHKYSSTRMEGAQDHTAT